MEDVEKQLQDNIIRQLALIDRREREDDASQSAMQLLETLQSANEQIKKQKYKYTFSVIGLVKLVSFSAGLPLPYMRMGKRPNTMAAWCSGL